MEHEREKRKCTKKSTTLKQRWQQWQAPNPKTTKSKDTGLPHKRKDYSNDKLQTLKTPSKSTKSLDTNL